MTAFIKKKLKDREGNYLVTPSSADIVYCSDGETVATKLRKVENDEFSPTITQMSTVSKVGVGEDIDISDNIQEGYLKSAILKGQTEGIADRFEQGSYSNWNGSSFSPSAIQTRLRTKVVYSHIGTLTLSVNNGYQLFLRSIEIESGQEYTDGWFQSRSFNFSSERKFVIIISKVDNTNISVEEFGDVGFETNFTKMTELKSVKMPVLTTSNEDGTKTNILTVNEDVELRGIGDVKDTLDCLTGEVTERIGEIVLDGVSTPLYDSQVGGNEALTYRVMTDMIVKEDTKARCLVDTFPSNVGNHAGDGIEGVRIIGNRLYLYIYKTRLSNPSRIGVMEYLKSNPMKVQYPMSQEVIKTVDLKPLGTNPTTQPYVWKDGHIHLSSEEGSLLPTLDYSVTTSRGGQILENTKHIAKQDKRIYDLEMLMINSSVEDAYQRLLLQNDVQVMSRMDETHLNPMRYYMLTRLIEEKMYEETDMLNKLDTFFLYGDISSDQYFELMDKIFGMEEIIEEDFTEEK